MPWVNLVTAAGGLRRQFAPPSWRDTTDEHRSKVSGAFLEF